MKWWIVVSMLMAPGIANACPQGTCAKCRSRVSQVQVQLPAPSDAQVEVVPEASVSASISSGVTQAIVPVIPQVVIPVAPQMSFSQAQSRTVMVPETTLEPETTMVPRTRMVAKQIITQESVQIPATAYATSFATQQFATAPITTSTIVTSSNSLVACNSRVSRLGHRTTAKTVESHGGPLQRLFNRRVTTSTAVTN